MDKRIPGSRPEIREDAKLNWMGEKMNYRTKSQRGITIIELLITCVIIGLVAAMAVPRFQTAYERIQFKGANRDITSTIKLARSMAITSKAQYGVEFDNEAKTITLFRDVNTGSYGLESGVDSVLRVDTLPHQFTYVGTDVTGNVIFFRANGSSDFSGGGNVYTLASSADLVAVYNSNVLASTGRVHVESYYY